MRGMPSWPSERSSAPARETSRRPRAHRPYRWKLQLQRGGLAGVCGRLQQLPPRQPGGARAARRTRFPSGRGRGDARDERRCGEGCPAARPDISCRRAPVARGASPRPGQSSSEAPRSRAFAPDEKQLLSIGVPSLVQIAQSASLSRLKGRHARMSQRSGMSPEVLDRLGPTTVGVDDRHGDNRGGPCSSACRQSDRVGRGSDGPARARAERRRRDARARRRTEAHADGAGGARLRLRGS
jgi:hypothetical protein